MKKMLLVAASLLAIPFAAQAQSSYVGLGAGQAKYKLDDSEFTNVSRDEKDSAYKIFGGYQFTKNWGLEVGYADLGKLRNVYNVSGVNVTLDGKSHVFYVAGTGTLPVGDNFSLFAKLGATRAHTSATASAAGLTLNESGNKGSYVAGIGAEYSFTKNVGLAFEYEDFNKVADDAKANMWSLSVRYKL